jgi:hypothetical protein
LFDLVDGHNKPKNEERSGKGDKGDIKERVSWPVLYANAERNAYVKSRQAEIQWLWERHWFSNAGL